MSGRRMARLAIRPIFYLWAAPVTLLGLIVAVATVATRGRLAIVDGVVEVQGGITTFLLRRLVPLKGGVAAMTLGHVVLGRDAFALERTRAHERVHVRQCEWWGPLFFPAYFVAGVVATLGSGRFYADNWFERQARTVGEDASHGMTM